MKHFLLISGLILLSLLSLGLVVGLFSVKETSFRCEATLPQSDENVDVYLKWGQYRWWVGLWSDSAGEIYLEIPNKLVWIQTETRISGPQIQILSWEGEYFGYFSKLSGTLAVDTPAGFLDAKCLEI